MCHNDFYIIICIKCTKTIHCMYILNQFHHYHFYNNLSISDSSIVDRGIKIDWKFISKAHTTTIWLAIQDRDAIVWPSCTFLDGNCFWSSRKGGILSSTPTSLSWSHIPYKGKLRCHKNLAKLTTDQKFTKFSPSKFLHIYSKVSCERNTATSS